MKKIFTISTQTISNTIFVFKKLPKASLFFTLLALLSLGFSGNAVAQCTCTNMVMSNGTPIWNGNEYCTGYNPAPINAPIINYTGTCGSTPAYSYKWEQNINSGGWTTILANTPGTTVATVPGFNPPALFNTPAGNPLATYQWRLTIVDSANCNQSAQSGNFTVFISSQLAATSIVTGTCTNTGAIDLIVSGGVSGASFAWTATLPGIVPGGQANNEDLTALTQGNYQVVISDGSCTNLNYNVTVGIPNIPPVAPADGGTIIECASAIVAPTPASVTDVCGTPLTPVGPVVTGSYTTCEGTVIYTWTYTDANSNSDTWSYTYTVDRTTAPAEVGGPVSNGSTVECATGLVAPTTLPVIQDICGNVLTPSGPVSGGTYTTCEGTITYTYTYLDCSGLSYDWVYTYNVDHTTAPVVSVANGVSTVECASSATAPNTPLVNDVCGNAISPVLVTGISGLFASNGGSAAGSADGGALMMVNQTNGLGTVIGTPITGAGITGIDFTSTGTLYGFVNNGNLITIDPLTGAVASTIGAMTYNSNNVILVDMAIQPGTDVIYGTAQGSGGLSSNALVTVNPTSGVVSLVGNTTGYGGGYLAIGFDVSGTLYGLQTNNPSNMFTMSPTTAATLTTIPVTPAIGAVGLGIDKATNTIYVSECCANGSTANNLWTVTPTGTATLVGSFGSTRRVQDLAFGTGGATTGTYTNCEGTKIYTYRYTDCAGLSTDWTYTYTIDHLTAPVVPVAGTSNGECALALAPTPPSITDVCGTSISPTGPVVTGTYGSCEGTVIYTWTYTDCSGLATNWVHTHTVDHVTAPVVSAPNGASTVECIADAMPPTTPSGIVDVCGASITANLDSTIDSPAPLTCEGSRTYYYSYTDCSGLSTPWTYTYTIDHTIAPVVPVNGASTVECIALAVAPTTPTVNDICGTPINAVLVSTVDTPDPLTCEGTRTYNYSYTDCSGLTTPWSYTYTIDQTVPPVVPANGASTVECLADAIPPATPAVINTCLASITPVLISTIDIPTSLTCEGSRTYNYTFTDCAGLSSAWSYTYTIDHTIAPLVPANGASTVECETSATAPTLPTVVDVCNTPITGVLTGVSITGGGSGGPTSQTYNYTGNLVSFTVPAGVTQITIDAKGAKGGASTAPGIVGGKGALTSGTFNVTPGQVLQVLVGGAGEDGLPSNPPFEAGGGGGGGSFVTIGTGFADFSSPLIAAGGGGGGYGGGGGQTLWNGGDGGTSLGGTGNGGMVLISTSGNYYAGGGGGILTDGQIGTTCSPNNNSGKSIISGAAGGLNGTCSGLNSITGSGGFGGGGGANWYGAGGGGYTGGNTNGPQVNLPSEGGTSYIAPGATASSNVSGVNNGNGQVVISWAGQSSIVCEGTKTYNYSYTDCSGLVSNWAYVYTIEHATAPVVPANGGTTVECLTSATAPTPPTGIVDVCGASVTAVLASTIDAPTSLTCEGSRTYNYTYTDCSGLVSNWAYVYTIDHTTAPIVSAPNGASTVECLASATAPTPPSGIMDVCGAPVLAVLASTVDAPDPLICEGTRTYNYTYTDCSGLVSNWAYVYTIDHTTAPAEVGSPVATTGTANCAADALAPTTLPDIKDVCGATLSPVGAPTIGGTSTGCAGTKTFTYDYLDCSGLSTSWTFTYTITPPAVALTCPNDTSISACLTQTDVTNLYNAWLAAASFTGGCVGVLSNNSTGAPSVGAGGTATVTFTVASACEADITCTKTFTVPAGVSATASLVSNVDCFGGNNGSASVSASGGTSPYTYSWAPTGGSGATASGLTAGVYTVSVTDANGCVNTSTVEIMQPIQVTVTASSTNVSCNGGSDGTITASGSLGSTISVNGNPLMNPYGVGTYTVTASAPNGNNTGSCTATTTVTITEPLLLVATETHMDVVCNGGSTGSATIAATGGTAPYTGTGTFSGLSAGTYTYSVSDANGCSSIVSVTIGQPTAIVPVLTITPITCFGLANGSASVAVPSGGTPYVPTIAHPLLYDYSWSTGGTGVLENLIAPGTHTLTLTDVNGCTGSTVFTMTEPPLLVATATLVTNATCFGLANGHAFVTITGGTPFPLNTYNISWSTGGTFINEYVLPAGTHTVTVTDANGCQTTATVAVTQPDLLVATSTAPAIACNGGTTIVTVGATGGTSPYTGTGTFTVSAGTYTYNVTDANGCAATTSITVTEPSVLSASSSATAIACNGGSATVTVSGSGGTSPYTGTGTFTVTAGSYTYIVTDANGCATTTSITVNEPSAVVASSSATAIACNGGTTTVTVSAIGGTSPYTGTGTFTETAGSYTYTVTDANGCATTTNITVSEPTAVVASSSATAIACNGGTTTVTVSATGGTSPYTGEGSFTETAGSYTYTVTDANGCTATTTITVTEPTAVVASSTSTAIACNGGTADVTVSAIGGTAPYTGTGTFTVTAGTHTYTVTDNNGCAATTTITVTEPSAVVASSSAPAIACNGGTTTVTVSATGGTSPYTGTGTFTVSVGTYTYNVTDANGCATTTSITVSEPSAVVASSSATAIACNGGTTTVTVSATGGTSPYTGTGTFTETAGSYTYTVTDANGCATTTSITVSEPTAVVASSSATAIACNGGTTTVTVSATGGTSPYTGEGSFTETAGSYTYTVTDANGCTATTTITVTEPTAVVASSSATAIACNGGSADVTVSGSGGTSPYTGEGTFTVTAGTHTYGVTDANGCTATTSITVTEPAVLVASSTSTAIACNGGTADVTVSATGGTAPYTGTGTFTVSAGTYTYNVTDANGCATTTIITVSEPSALSASSSATAIACNGGSATVTVSGSGGTSPYMGEGTFTVTAGTHTYIVTDANGCTATTSITVSEPSAVVASSSATAIVCNGGSATVTVSGSGGTSPYTGEGTFTVTAGTYTYTVTDANGCTATTSITVGEPAVITMSSSPVSCDNYTWNMNTYTMSGVHTATFTAANGCDSVHTINLTINYSSSSTISHTASLTYTWPVSGLIYTNSGTYTGTLVGGNAVGCDSVITLNLTILGVSLSSKVFLDGPYNGAGLMHDSLRVQGGIPATEPYSGAPFFKPSLGDASGETAFASYLADNGNASIVDWVFLELRSGTLPNPGIVYTQRALVRRDGQIVSEVDGVSPVTFSTAPAGNYFVSIKHRNHLGVMTNAMQALTLGGATVDFTTIALWTKVSIPALVNTPARLVSGVQVLWAGDANRNRNVKYNGASNDKESVLLAVGGSAVPNNITLPGYRVEDVNMDGVVKYNNTNADRLTILGTVGSGTPNAIYNQHTPD